MGGYRIPWKKEVNYLGVIIADELTFKKHCQKVRRKVIAARTKPSRLIGRKSVLNLRDTARKTIKTPTARIYQVKKCCQRTVVH